MEDRLEVGGAGNEDEAREVVEGEVEVEVYDREGRSGLKWNKFLKIFAPMVNAVGKGE